MMRKVIAAIAAAAIGMVGFGATSPAASAESKCPVWMCGTNGTLLSGMTLDSQNDESAGDRIASNGTQLSGIRLPAAGH